MRKVAAIGGVGIITGYPLHVAEGLVLREEFSVELTKGRILAEFALQILQHSSCAGFRGSKTRRRLERKAHHVSPSRISGMRATKMNFAVPFSFGKVTSFGWRDALLAPKLMHHVMKFVISMRVEGCLLYTSPSPRD